MINSKNVNGQLIVFRDGQEFCYLDYCDIEHPFADNQKPC